MLFRNYLSWKRAWPFICQWTNLNHHQPGMLSAKFGWNWPSGSGEDFFKFHQCIFAISQSSPNGKELGYFIINIVYQEWNVNFNACLILYLLFVSVWCISGSQICKILNIKMMHLGKNVDYQIKFPRQYITVYRKNHYPWPKLLWNRQTK